MPIRALLFDLDGTLVDSNELHVEAWVRVLAEAGYPVAAEAVRGRIGMGADMLVPSLIPGASAELVERLGEAHGALYKRDYLPRVRAFQGARELLVRAHEAGQLVVLASSASQNELDHYVALLDIGEIVSATTTADDVAHTKPAPDIFLTALGKVAPVTPDEALVIGDTPYDVEAARAAGTEAVAVLSGGFAEERLRNAGAVAIYPDVAALLADFARSPLAGA